MRALLVLSLLLGTAAFAHKPSDSLLSLRAERQDIDGRWDIAVRDLDHVLGLDEDRDGRVTWAELQQGFPRIREHAAHALTLSSGARPCPLEVEPRQVVRHSDGAYVLMAVHARCDEVVRELSIDYRLFFEADPQHRGLVQLSSPSGQTQSLILSAERHTERVSFTTSSRWSSLSRMFIAGTGHIAVGWDHLLFLVALLMPSVLKREANGWVPRTRFVSTLGEVVRIVTAFTLAHSCTLSLAALGWIGFPSRWIETAIAGSVVLVALNNLFGVLPAERWSAAFALGLLHGFGLASTFDELGLSRSELLTSLLGFNLGVEAGQLLIVAVFVPLAYLARKTAAYQQGLVSLGSVAVAALASYWLLARALL